MRWQQCTCGQGEDDVRERDYYRDDRQTSILSLSLVLGIITQITWGSEYVGGLLALLPFGAAILEPDLKRESRKMLRHVRSE